MKKLGVLSVFVLLVFSQCQKENDSPSLTGKWLVMSIKNLQTQEELVDPTLVLSSTTERNIVLDFSDDGATGQITGKIGPNTAQATYRLNPDKSLEVGSIGGTKIGSNLTFIDSGI
jgi:hypothetical protein